MRDHLTLGSTPCGENCAQLGQSDYHEKVRIEARAYITQLIRQFGKPPTGSLFSVKAFPHDFGTYHEVVVWYDDTLEESVEFAYNVDKNLPEEWDAEAHEYLADAKGLVRES